MFDTFNRLRKSSERLIVKSTVENADVIDAVQSEYPAMLSLPSGDMTKDLWALALSKRLAGVTEQSERDAIALETYNNAQTRIAEVGRKTQIFKTIVAGVVGLVVGIGIGKAGSGGAGEAVAVVEPVENTSGKVVLVVAVAVMVILSVVLLAGGK